MKNSVILYHDYLETIFSELTDTEVGQLVKALLIFDSTGRLTDFDDRTVRTAYRRLISDCEHNQLKYAKMVERNRQNGKKGGRPKTQDNPMGFLITQDNPQKADNDNVNDNVNVNDNDNVNGNDIAVYTTASGGYASQEEAELNIIRNISLMKMQGTI